MSEPRSAVRDLGMEAVRVTEQAALAAARLMGHGDEEAADRAAAGAMHAALAGLAIQGTVRVGEGDGGEAGRLFVGQTVGSGEGPAVDVALLPLEGPTIIAKGEPNGLSVLAMAEEGSFLSVPDVYMEKIAVGCGLPADVVSLDAPPAENLRALAAAKGADVGDLVVCTLDRPRHQDLIASVREAGARIMLIPDGDLSGMLAASQPESGVDIYMGVGNASQGVLAAAALACIEGQMQARLKLRNDEERTRARERGIGDFDRIYRTRDLAWGDITFAATGVTGGALLAGVRVVAGSPITHSLVLRSRTGSLDFIESHHRYAREAAMGRGRRRV